MRGAVLTLVAGLLSGLTAAPALADDAEAVKAVVADFHQAMAEGYKDGVLALLAPDAVVFETGYIEASRDQYAAGHLDNDLLYAAKVKYRMVHSQAEASGDLGYVITQGVSEGEFAGQAIHLANTETMVLRRIDGAWKIVHIHWSAHEPPAN
ncbi:MAG: nuclear transport factor 2 family protein [Nevskiales bacterium]|nr:nuclear transport factor 2 family protein [Nevskiales bacterium]